MLRSGARDYAGPGDWGGKSARLAWFTLMGLRPVLPNVDRPGFPLSAWSVVPSIAGWGAGPGVADLWTSPRAAVANGCPGAAIAEWSFTFRPFGRSVRV
jgi:hypothetical protein